MPLPLLAPVVGTLVGGLARFLAVDFLKMMATKALIISVVGLLLPVVLYRFLDGILLEYLTYVSGSLPGMEGVSAQIVQLTGIGGWVAIHLKLPQAFSLVMSACALRWALNAIPFVRI